MVTWFTFGCTAVMAVCTARSNASVVHCSTSKTRGVLMTSLARSSRLNVVTWFAFRSTTVMAVSTSTDNSRMVHRTSAEGSC